MTLRTLIRRSLRFHWRSHLGVVLGAAIGSAALIGALVVGDSVKGSLREQALQKLPNTWAALSSGERFFSDTLIERMSVVSANQESPLATNPPRTNAVLGFPNDASDTLGHELIQLPASVSVADGRSRANAVTIYGVDDKFASESLLDTDGANLLKSGSLILNAALARHLGVRPNDELVLRIPKPTTFSYENAVSPRADATIALRLKVTGVLPEDAGNLSIQSGRRNPFNVFVQRAELARQSGLVGQANLLLIKPALSFQPTSLPNRFRRIQMMGNQGFPSPFRDLSWHRSSDSVTGEAVSSSETALLATEMLAAAWSLSDTQCRVKPPGLGTAALELSTTRIFLDPPIVSASLVADTSAQPILTYLTTLLRAGTNAAPYSMVTAASAPWTPTDLRDDEIVISQWLADDLHVKSGDEIALSYFLPESGAKLEEATNIFRVHRIVPMEIPWADRTLMPDFPGIEKAESTRDWDAGFPLTYKIRDQDEKYWKEYRGTPKAFITLAAGQKMWGNRFGNLTAIRFPIPTNFVGDEVTSLKSSPADAAAKTNQFEPPHVVAYKDALEKKILSTLKPEELGLRFEPVREQALKAAEESQDFGGLFLGFSFFVIAAALLLMAMLFQFGLEQRAPEIGTLLALGFTPKQVRKLVLGEGLVLSFLGGVIGAVGGIYFAKAMLHGLTTIWRDAVGATALSFHVTAQTLVIGLFASVVVSSITIWLALRKFVRLSPRELLNGADLECGDLSPSSGEGQSMGWKRVLDAVRCTAMRGAAWATSRPSGKSGDKSPHSIAWLALAGAVGLVGWTLARGDLANAGAFFGAGALVLMAGLSFVSAWLAHLSGVPVSDPAHSSLPQRQAGPEAGAPFTTLSLAVRGCARRRKRSLATVAMLACGSFLIVSIGVFRLDANRDATERSSGTGGFALIGETTIPVVQDLNSASGRNFFALNERDLAGVNVVPFRVRAGDEASCLNLNAAQKPRLLGVKPEMLTKRVAFSFSKLMEGAFAKTHPWSLLSKTSVPDRAPVERDEIPAIGDANSIQWAMKKKVGDTIDYVDERGQPFKVRIVGAVANSILQGQLIIDEAEFVKRFPGESGHRMFLIDAPSNAVSQVSATLSRAMQDVGLELTPAAQRLNQFNAVQNTYLGTFQVLGGLGLLLGSVGLGIVVLRNVLERRGELAVLMAVGFRKVQLQRLLLMENGALLLAGLALGIVAATVAVLPALLSANGELPVVSLGITLGVVLVNGVLWTWAATKFAVRGDLLKALRNE